MPDDPTPETGWEAAAREYAANASFEPHRGPPLKGGGSVHTPIIQHQWAALVEERNDLLLRVTALEAAIRRHRDERGDDRCHLDDGTLYAVLPEGDTRPDRETAVTLENCQRFIRNRQCGREYISPQVRIEELEAEVARLYRIETEHLLRRFPPERLSRPPIVVEYGEDEDIPKHSQ